jgi:hypothetical protein
MDAVDPTDPAAGLCVVGYFGDLHHVAFTPAGTASRGQVCHSGGFLSFMSVSPYKT